MNIYSKMYVCMPRTITPFAKLLEEKFLDWERREGTRKALFEYANFLGVNRPTLSQWMNGKRTPQDKDLIELLARKLGNDVYDALGLPRPDPEFAYVHYRWKELSSEQKSAVKEQIIKFLSDHAGE